MSLHSQTTAQLIRQVRLLDPINQVDQIGDCYLENGKIRAIGESISSDAVPYPSQSTDKQSTAAVELIDGTGQWLLSGFVDLAAYLREPGLEYKATLASEVRAAAHAGISTLCYSPEPAVQVNSRTQVNMVQEINQQQIKPQYPMNIAMIGNLTRQLDGETLSNMGSLKQAGCVGVGNGLQPIKNLHVLRMALQYAASHDLTVFLHPLDHHLMNQGCVHESPISSRLGLPSIPVSAETAALAAMLMLVAETGARVHICRVSSAASVTLLYQAKQSHLPVTADVAMHQLWLTEQDIADFNPLCHVMPPLRSAHDRDQLIQAVADGVIDAICSDHQPHNLDAKLAPFQETEAGISAFDSFLPLLLRLIEDKQLTMSQALNAVTHNPATIIKQACGTLTVGATTDLILLDPKAYWELSETTMYSAGKNSPFLGWALNGKVKRRFV
ncbi:MAG TPA: dihydroorotase [Thiothrix sp.]|nr:dihydroorotase [Thiothrix sp.]